MSAPRRNLEIKARCGNLLLARKAAEILGAHLHAEEHQRDTFFPVSAGRLKLREAPGQPAVLIWYDRPNQADARSSHYHVVPLLEAGPIKTALTAALGTRGEVRKRRIVYLWNNVRIHFDDVDNLGTFVELEAVLGPGDSGDVAHVRLAEACRVLEIGPSDHVALAYADLLGL